MLKSVFIVYVFIIFSLLFVCVFIYLLSMFSRKNKEKISYYEASVSTVRTSNKEPLPSSAPGQCTGSSLVRIGWFFLFGFFFQKNDLTWSSEGDLRECPLACVAFL